MGGGELIKKGWLVKSPPLESSGIKSWRKRWFCLRSSKVIEYYKNESSSDVKGVINLEDCVSVHASLFHRKYKHVFDIQTKERTYYLVASTAKEMEDWVQTICDVCGFHPTNDENKGINDTTAANSLSTSSNKRLSLTLPSNFSVRSSPLPPIPSESRPPSDQPHLSSQHSHRLLTVDQKPTATTTTATNNNNKVHVHVPAGTSFTEALAAKGYRSPSIVSSSSVSRESVTLECYVPHPPPDKLSYLESLGFQTYDVPSSSQNSKVPDWYDVPRSLIDLDSTDLSDESYAHYMVPRHAYLQKVDSNSSQWATPPSNIYDVPPPPRPAYNASSTNIYDVPPPPRLASTNIYDIPPPPRPAYTNYELLQDSTDSPYQLPPRPFSAEPPEITKPLPPRSSEEYTDHASSSGYVNIKLVNEIISDSPSPPPPPPVIDRANKPHPPSIDRSTKPRHSVDHVNERMSSSFSDEEGIPQTSNSPCNSEEDFSPKEIPKLTRSSIRYCHVTFSKKPIPTPRVARTSREATPTTTSASSKVNYVDVDLSATAKLIQQESIEYLSEGEKDDIVTINDSSLISTVQQSLQVTNI